MTVQNVTARANIMFFLLIFVVLLNSTSSCVGRHVGGSKGIIKTIKIGDGEIIDCVDILKQPAFSHPRLTNHTIQMKPSNNGTSGMRSHRGKLKLRQSWHKYGRCPQDSIPISRKQVTRPQRIGRRQIPSQSVMTKYHQKIDSNSIVNYANYPQHAIIILTETSQTLGAIHGAHATLNLWNPTVSNPQDFSLSQMWLISGDEDVMNTVEAGWQVFPQVSGNQPRFFTYWTSDDYLRTGCYDLDCPGFVQVSKDILVGAHLVNFSVYGGQQTEIYLSIEKDQQSGNWWLTLEDTPIGYWPSSIFTTLANAADAVEWGGEVFNAPNIGHNNGPSQMGSGHFPNEGFKKSSYIRDIKYTDASGTEIYPSQENFTPFVTNSSCYDVRMEKLTVDNEPQLYLFFGGPGCA